MKIHRSISLVPLVCLASALSALSTQAAVSIYLSPNGIESAETSGINDIQVTTETFSTGTGYVSSYNGAIGIYAGDGFINAEDIYGGYQEGNYLGIQTGQAMTVTLTTAASYFGFYFSAGDAGNVVELFSGGNLLLTFKTGDLIAMLPNTNGSQIQAINGSLYNTKDYYGQPNGPNQAATNNEPYAYVHFVGTGGTTFDKIRFSEPTTATFETDNHSVRTNAPALPGSLVDITGAVPEPSGAALAAFSFGTLALFRRRRA
ncbi:PEP-CTERM sorting domain-containing protein [Luteolibacter soli]|uniref:PEP-CTERM sorting domain-containing protein n=1 Tax=Luteolibacter soli TaxID=3135280 RepID=A0ABU9ATK0_9BACT